MREPSIDPTVGRTRGEIREPVQVATGQVTLAGDLVIPSGAEGLVLFAHGSGSSRFSSRNRFVADALARAGHATLLIDLLTQEEDVIDDATGQLRFDIPRLASRLIGAVDWLADHGSTRWLRVGCFGASTGAAAALIAAAERPARVHAVVSRGGRPDLAGPALAFVRAPTVFVVGGHDNVVVELNQRAFAELGASFAPAAFSKELAIVPRATHLFEEPGALEQVASLAADWFTRFLRPTAQEKRGPP